MNRSAVIESERIQRVLVACFMALLLALATALAYAAVYQPPVEVRGSGLTISLPPSWVADREAQKTPLGEQQVFRDERRPSLRLVFTAMDPALTQGQARVDPEPLLRWMSLMQRVSPPEGAVPLTRQAGPLSVAQWEGVFRSRIPYFGTSQLSALAVITGPEGRVWLLQLSDLKYNVERIQDRARRMEATFNDVLGTVRYPGG